MLDARVEHGGVGSAGPWLAVRSSRPAKALGGRRRFGRPRSSAPFRRRRRARWHRRGAGAAERPASARPRRGRVAGCARAALVAALDRLEPPHGPSQLLLHLADLLACFLHVAGPGGAVRLGGGFVVPRLLTGFRLQALAGRFPGLVHAVAHGLVNLGRAFSTAWRISCFAFSAASRACSLSGPPSLKAWLSSSPAVPGPGAGPWRGSPPCPARRPPPWWLSPGP